MTELKITQADRDAAASNMDDDSLALLVSQGELDSYFMVQAFARHRIAAEEGKAELWQNLADRAISLVESAIRETSWGQPTFGPDYGEELRSEYAALARVRGEG